MSELNRDNREIQQKVEERPEASVYRQLDSDTVEKIGQKFRDTIPPGRIETMKHVPTQFDSREEFNRAYQNETGRHPADNVGGFSTGVESPAHVLTEDKKRVPEITTHERIHQAGDPNADRIFGKMYEGVTQDLTVKTLDSKDGTVGYQKERRSAELLRKTCGDKAVEKAYFKGDPTELRQCLEKADLDPRHHQETGSSQQSIDKKI